MHIRGHSGSIGFVRKLLNHKKIDRAIHRLYYTITDWGGNDGYTLDKGTEIEMPSLANNSLESVNQLIADGTLTREEADAQVDEALRRILRAYGYAGYKALSVTDGTHTKASITENIVSGMTHILTLTSVLSTSISIGKPPPGRVTANTSATQRLARLVPNVTNALVRV